MADHAAPTAPTAPKHPRQWLPGALQIGVLAGIPVRVHWTFPLLLAWIAYTVWADGPAAIAYMTALVLVIFGCVVLHELGHALMARRFGVRTRHITLFPIGGVAQLEGMPEKPGEEVLVALAGPAVNVVIGGTLIVGLLTASGPPSPAALDLSLGFSAVAFLWHVATINLFLAVFNMIPAFPMDGGRVLRALLATSMARSAATAAAARVGLVMAIGFAVLGLVSGNPVLLLIAVFVFLAGSSEAHAVSVQETLAGLRVHQAMMTEFEVLGAERDLTFASERLIAGSQHQFPVAEGDRIIGVIDRDALFQAVETHGGGASVRTALAHGSAPVEPSAPVVGALAEMRRLRIQALPVLDHGRLVGLLTLENIDEVAGLRRAARRRGARTA